MSWQTRPDELFPHKNALWKIKKLMSSFNKKFTFGWGLETCAPKKFSCFVCGWGSEISPQQLSKQPSFCSTEQRKSLEPLSIVPVFSVLFRPHLTPKTLFEPRSTHTAFRHWKLKELATAKLSVSVKKYQKWELFGSAGLQASAEGKFLVDATHGFLDFPKCIFMRE